MLNDLVRLKAEFGDRLVPIGSLGMVLAIHDSDPPTYTVEFFNRKAVSLGLHTVEAQHIHPPPRRYY